MKLRVGFSPCPNDTFIFDALVHQRFDLEGLQIEPVLADVEELNRMAFAGELAVTKLSYHALGHLINNYRILNAGSALGHGCGPLVIANSMLSQREVTKGTMAIPGHYTTANLLVGLAYPQLTDKVEVLFSEIEDQVVNGQATTGLIIHENRFTYARKGLVKIRDLGEFWEGKTGLPIPLGGIGIRRDISTEVQLQFDRVLRRSIEYAFQHPDQSLPYIQRHAQAMTADVMRAHINLYVNEYSLDLGEQGKQAIRILFQEAVQTGFLPDIIDDDLFV